MASRTAASLIACLVVAAGCFAGAVGLDTQVQTVRAHEVSGAMRGAFLDAAGKPIVSSLALPDGKVVRRYALPGTAETVGYADPAGHWHGLESRFDSILRPHTPTSWLQSLWMHLRGEAATRNNVRLTLDSVLQNASDRALGRGPGAVVALDPRNGSILAMLSKPDCTPEQLASHQLFLACAHGNLRPLLNRVTQRPVPPGSSFKAVTLTAALDTGQFHLDDVFSGPEVFGPSPYFDNSQYPSNITRTDLTAITLEQALAFSDNFTFAHIGLTLGAPTLLQYAHRFGLDRPIPFDIPTAASTVALDRSTLTDSETAQASFGASVDRTTPLQMALVAAAVANRGVLMRPRMVEDVETQNGHILRRYKPKILAQVMTPATADAVAQAMTFVVDSGSGFRAQISGIEVAGKTGTADSGSAKPNAWFIAFAPAQHPIIAVAVLRERSGEGADYAAPIARQLILAALKEHARRAG